MKRSIQFFLALTALLAIPSLAEDSTAEGKRLLDKFLNDVVTLSARF